MEKIVRAVNIFLFLMLLDRLMCFSFQISLMKYFSVAHNHLFTTELKINRKKKVLQYISEQNISRCHGQWSKKQNEGKC